MIFKRCAAFLLCLVLFSMAAVTAFADDRVLIPKNDGFMYYANDYSSALYADDYKKTENAYFRDESEMLNSTEIGSAFEEIQNAADKTGIKVAVFIGGQYRNDSLTEAFTQECTKLLFGENAETNSVFLYMDFEGHSPSYDYICTYHDAKLYYPNSGFDDRVEEMVQNMYKYLPKSGKTIYSSAVTGAIECFCNDVVYYYDQGSAWESTYYNQEDSEYRYVFFGNVIKGPLPPYRYWWFFVILGVLIGLVVAASSVSSIRKKYKFRETPNASAYTSRNRIRFNSVNDQFMREHTSSYRIQSSSSSGGGGGGGGGSFGGGGGHR